MIGLEILYQPIFVREDITTDLRYAPLGIDELYQIPDELWKKIQILLPPPKKHKRKNRLGRPKTDDPKAMNGILKTCAWTKDTISQT